MRKLLTAALGAVILSTGAASAEVRELRVTTAAPEKTPWGVYFNKANAEAKKNLQKYHEAEYVLELATW